MQPKEFASKLRDLQIKFDSPDTPAAYNIFFNNFLDWLKNDDFFDLIISIYDY
jgi:hypothetical protein